MRVASHTLTQVESLEIEDYLIKRFKKTPFAFLSVLPKVNGLGTIETVRINLNIIKYCLILPWLIWW